MWIMLNDAFFSIVKKDCAKDELLVRARRPDDIAKVFGNVEVEEDLNADYRYRAKIKIGRVAESITLRMFTLNYPNFKNSVKSEQLHDAYVRVWSDMVTIQPKRVQSAYRGRG